MVQIPTRTRTRTLSFSVREPGCARQRPAAEEPDAKRARHHAPPLPLRSTPLAPKSVNLTVTAVPVPFPADQDEEWGTDKLPSTSSSSPADSKGKKLVAKTTKPLPEPPVPSPSPSSQSVPRYTLSTRARTPSPLAPYWKPGPISIASRQRRGRIPPEPLCRKAIKAHFARTPHGAAVVKLGARRAIAQAECVAAVERVRKLSGEKEMRPKGLDVPPPVLLPPVLMDADLKFEETPTKRSSRMDRLKYPQRFAVGVAFPMASEQMVFPCEESVRFPTTAEDDSWVPLSVQSGAVPVDMEECDIVEMETDPDWARI